MRPLSATILGPADAAGAALRFAGRRGPALLVGSLIAGLVVPDLAGMAYDALPVSAYFLTLGSLLAAGLSPAERHPDRKLLAFALIWVTFLLPAAIGWSAAQMDLPAPVRAGVALSFAAPPVGSAAAIAAMLGLRPRLALLLSLSLTLVAPITMPLSVALVGREVSPDLHSLSLRLFGIVGGAGVTALVLLRWRRLSRRVLPDVQAGSGVAVLGLVIVGLATTIGVRRHWVVDPAGFMFLLALASSLNLLACAAGAVVFRAAGRANAATVGLVSGNRNVTLAWAAASGPGLASETEAFVAACVVPILSLPLLIQAIRVVVRWRRARVAGLGATLVFAATTAQAQEVPFAACTPLPHEDRCVCSIHSVETLLSFPEAAELLLTYYKDSPDERFEGLMGSLLRACAFGWQRRLPPAMVLEAPLLGHAVSPGSGG